MTDKIFEFGAGVIGILGIVGISIALLKGIIWLIINFGSGL